jgi:GGDEF domain-containing protein
MLLRASSREFDLAARYGGEKLELIAAGSGGADAETMAQQFRVAVHAIDTPIPVTISIGGLPSPATPHTEPGRRGPSALPVQTRRPRLRNGRRGATNGRAAYG